MPHLSAYITSYARVKLHNYLRAAKQPVYCDTDSVHCNWLGENSMELGKMKLEKKMHDFRAFNPKVYECREFKKAKGIPHRKLDELDSIEELYGKAVTWESLAGLASSLRARNGIVFGDGLVKYITRKRMLRKGYDKRSINPDRTTSPWSFIENRLEEPLYHKSPQQCCIAHKSALR